LTFRNNNKLSLARALVGEAEYLIACRKYVRVGTNLSYNPRQIATLAGRERGRSSIVHCTLTDRCFARVDAGCFHFYKDLAPTGDRAWNSTNLEDINVSVVIKDNCSHLCHHFSPLHWMCDRRERAQHRVRGIHGRRTNIGYPSAFRGCIAAQEQNGQKTCP
jgi:hypothetical protein